MTLWARAQGSFPEKGQYARVIRPRVGDVIRVGCPCGHVFGQPSHQIATGEGVLLCPKCGAQDNDAILESWDQPAAPLDQEG